MFSWMFLKELIIKNSKRSIFEDISLLQFVKLKRRISISDWVKFEKKAYLKIDFELLKCDIILCVRSNVL